MGRSFETDPLWHDADESQRIAMVIMARLNYAVHRPEVADRQAAVNEIYETGFNAGLSVEELNELYEEVLSQMRREQEPSDAILYDEAEATEKIQIWPYPMSAPDEEHDIPPVLPWWDESRRPE